MTAACLLLISSVVGQYPYANYATGGYVPGYGGYYWRTPLSLYDPMRYARFYKGTGYYTYTPPAIANPEVINLRPPATNLPGATGMVLALDERQHRITIQLPAGTLTVPYGSNTHFLSADGNFPVIKPGSLINVNQNTITVLRPAPQKQK